MGGSLRALGASRYADRWLGRVEYVHCVVATAAERVFMVVGRAASR